jgi:hypothetical protein
MSEKDLERVSKSVEMMITRHDKPSRASSGGRTATGLTPAQEPLTAEGAGHAE